MNALYPCAKMNISKNELIRLLYLIPEITSVLSFIYNLINQFSAKFLEGAKLSCLPLLLYMIIIASHSAEDIAILCDTVSEMDKGVLKEIR